MDPYPPSKISVAPMMDWTDRHCRYLHRQISARAELWTEMVAAPALVQGGALHLLDHDPAEHPLVLQLGGADPGELAAAVRLAAGRGFAGINLNVGCPSDRVQSGCFGAVLMRRPALVAECCAAMLEAAGPDGPAISVKCRIGVDEQTPEDVLPAFLETVAATGVRRFVIHARKAWLQGLSPKENREVPPLDHALVVAMKRAFPALEIWINGGITRIGEVEGFLAQGLDGAMIGRAAYHDPMGALAEADARLHGGPPPPAPEAVVAAMEPYIARHLAAGGRLHQVTRHMLGLFAGRPGARAWRRCLSERASRPGAGLDVLRVALAAVTQEGLCAAS
ncbi:MAG: tRNA dihydrouridine(20/20a) synthase DusA [Thermohalobaculum sp.]|nr:tRNA dihydrouridine(20/20a) synthase DusA [Thermohalobaculum sp.]